MVRWESHEADLRTVCAEATIDMVFDTVKPPFEKAYTLQTPVVDPGTDTNTLLGKVLVTLKLCQLSPPVKKKD
jgi:hypothetical protein